ncbi:MAG: hypothetical protein GVY19_03655 [Bacteroidetes bacterium]|jgi:hypothetical protein|nr:hypothetical protein [Bacteroidota bacterium]
MDLTLEERIDEFNKSVEHLILLSYAQYDCDKPKFKKLVQNEIFKLLNELDWIEEDLEDSEL